MHAPQGVCLGDGAEAERLLTQALALDPDAPDLLNNLGMAYEYQGRRGEAYALVRELHPRHPDYFFARIGLAQLAIQQGNHEEARALLAPLLTQQRVHTSEFAALCRVEIELLLAQHNREAARSWFELWQSTDPDNPALRRYQGQLACKPWSRLFGWRTGRRRER